MAPACGMLYDRRPPDPMRWPFGRDTNELLFRALFSTIFLGLGGEHLFHDELIQRMMPGWVLFPRLVSIASGLVLVTGGSMVFAGYRLRLAARILGTFLVVVTLAVHLPGVLGEPRAMDADDIWMWTVLQRSNLVKNLCLFGVCIQLGQHTPGRYSVEGWLRTRAER